MLMSPSQFLILMSVLQFQPFLVRVVQLLTPFKTSFVQLKVHQMIVHKQTMMEQTRATIKRLENG